MSIITDATKALADALATDIIPAYDYVPEDFTPPGIILQPAPRWVAADPDMDDTRFNEFALYVEAWLLVPLEDNQTASDDLADLIEHVLTHLPDGWGLDNIDQPGPAGPLDWIQHGCKVSLSRYIQL